MKLNDVNEALDKLLEGTLPSIDKLPVDKLGINARKRVEKLIPAVQTHFFVTSRKGAGGEKPVWEYANEKMEISWKVNTLQEEEKDLQTVYAIAKRAKSVVSYERTDSIVEFKVSIPVGKIEL